MSLHIYLPQDRLRAIMHGASLPDHTTGAALFADISGFTPLTEALRNSLGPRRGAEELTRQLDAVYSALVAEVERYGGSVIGFAGDAMLCWFNAERIDETVPTSPSTLAVACGLALQRAMSGFAKIILPDQSITSLSLKVAIATGPARRFVVGDPQINLMDVLAGATITRTSLAEHHAQKGEVLIDAATAEALGAGLDILEWRENEESRERFAVVATLTQPVEPASFAPLDMGGFAIEKLHPWLYRPLIEREQFRQDAFLSEFRPCAVLFLRFIGIDYDSDDEIASGGYALVMTDVR